MLLFCVVFGLSMDYEVFLLTRMQEAWRRTHDNRAAVAEGLERSGRLVTGAAAIMITVFLAFGLARVVTIKATGIGMAVAVLADATLVRALVVPALMRLLGTRQLVGAALGGAAARGTPRTRPPEASGWRSHGLRGRRCRGAVAVGPWATRTRSRYSATSRRPVSSSPTLATTWYAGSSGSGRTSTKPPSTNTLRPSTRSSSRPSWSSSEAAHHLALGLPRAELGGGDVRRHGQLAAHLAEAAPGTTARISSSLTSVYMAS